MQPFAQKRLHDGSGAPPPIRAEPSRSVCAPPRPSVPHKVGTKGGTHPTPRSRTRTPVAYPLPISYPFTRCSCAQTRGGGGGAPLWVCMPPLCRNRAGGERGGLPMQSSVHVNGCRGSSKKGGCPAWTCACIQFACEQRRRGQMGGGLPFTRPLHPRMNGCRGRGQKKGGGGG